MPAGGVKRPGSSATPAAAREKVEQRSSRRSPSPRKNLAKGATSAAPEAAKSRGAPRTVDRQATGNLRSAAVTVVEAAPPPPQPAAAARKREKAAATQKTAAPKASGGRRKEAPRPQKTQAKLLPSDDVSSEEYSYRSSSRGTSPSPQALKKRRKAVLSAGPRLAAAGRERSPSAKKRRSLSPRLASERTRSTDSRHGQALRPGCFGRLRGDEDCDREFRSQRPGPWDWEDDEDWWEDVWQWRTDDWHDSWDRSSYRGRDEGKGWMNHGKGRGKGGKSSWTSAATTGISRIHASNLPKNTTEDSLVALFQGCGKVLGVKILAVRGGTASAIVRFGTCEAAEAAIADCHGMRQPGSVGGPLEVKLARPNPRWET